MAVVLFTVKATITPDREEAFNTWYHTEHIPQLLQYPGAVSARRYKQIAGKDGYQYMVAYEFESQETYDKFMASDHFQGLIAEYNANFGEASDREWFSYQQVWP